MLQAVHHWQCIPDAVEDGADASICACSTVCGLQHNMQLLT